VRRFAAKHAPDGDQRIVLPVAASFFAASGNSNGSWNVHHVNIPCGPRLLVSSASTGRRKKPLGNKTIETAHDDAKAKARRAQLAANFPGCNFSAIANPRRSLFLSFISFTSFTSFTSL